MPEIAYPTESQIIEYNALAITIFEVKKKDKAEVLSFKKITEAIDKCKEDSGDIHDKATTLLTELVKAHAFASGNRRTALIVAIDFLETNNTRNKIGDNPENASILQGIREGYYTKDEIKEWIRNGKIRPFTR